MKNKILKLLLLVLVVTTIFSCGTNKENTLNGETQTLAEVDKNEQIESNNDDTKRLLVFKNILDEVNREVKVGDIVKYGVMSYESNDYYGRDAVPMIEWEVLDVKKDKALITTKQIILAEKFVNEEGEKANWANSIIRTECQKALGYIFSEYEEEGIIETEITTDGKKTKDKIFILSIEEFLKYYGDNDKEGMNLKAISIAANSVRRKGLETRTNEDSEYYGAGSYWLRDNGTKDGNAMWVGQYGHLYREGYDKNLLNGIRPAMWVKKDHLIYEKRIKLGAFEQDNIEENGKEDISWYVLEMKDNMLCLYSKDILFNMQYDEETKGKEYCYSESKIRKRLTQDFYENSFSEKEKEVIEDIRYEGAITKFHHSENYKDENEYFSDKVIILSNKEYKRYVGHKEDYYPPDSIRYESKMTKYAETSSDSPYIEDELNMNYVKNTHKSYWLRDVGSDGMYNPTNEVKGFTTSDRNFFISSKVYMSYGVRPFIAINLEKVKAICDKNIDVIEKLQSEEVKEEKSETKVYNNSKYDNDENILFGKKDNKILAYFNRLLKDKYNLLLDITHYDIDNNKNEATFLVKSYNRSFDNYYNKYQGFLKYKFDLSEKGFPINEELIDEYDLINVDNTKNKERENFAITEKNYVITLLKILNPNYIKSYEKFAIKKSIMNKYPNYLTKGLLFDDENVKKNEKDDFNTFTVFSKSLKRNEYSDTGYEDLDIRDGKNEYDLDVVCYDKIAKYKLIVDVKYVDEENYYIEDINHEYLKTINKPSGHKEPKYFLNEDHFPMTYNYVKELDSILVKEKREETVQKEVSTYEELVAIAKEEKRKKEELEYNGELDKMDSVVQDWHYDDRDWQTGIINSGDGLNLMTMKFGKYPQGKEENQKEDIEWYILSNSNGKKLLISKYILDNKKFSDTNILATWEDSTLRKWINTDFYNTAFNDSEKKKIMEVEIKSYAKEVEYDVLTKDRVFLLSFEDYKKYFRGVSNANVNPYGSTYATEYAKNVKNEKTTIEIANKPSYDREAYSEGNSCYWLRDRREGLDGDSYEYDYVLNVSAIGQVLTESFYDTKHSGVRPVILIKDSQGSNNNSKEEKKKDVRDINNQKESEKEEYETFLTLGGKEIYIDEYTYIFTFEENDKVILGRLDNTTYPMSLSELEKYLRNNNYYFDEEKKLLYFSDWSEVYKAGPLKEYKSLCVIDDSLRKIKLFENDEHYNNISVNEQLVKQYESKLKSFN